MDPIVIVAIIAAALGLTFSERVWNWLYGVWDGMLDHLWRS